MKILLFFSCCIIAILANHVNLVIISDVHLDLEYGTDRAYINNELSATCNESSALFEHPLGQKGCDSPLSLLDSLVEDISQHYPNTHVIFAGDWVRHRVPDAESTQRTFRAVAERLARIPHSALAARRRSMWAASNSRSQSPPLELLLSNLHILAAPAPVVPILGNNDFFPDYHFNVSEKEHALLNNISSVLLDSGIITKDEEANLKHCGYYARQLHDLGLKLIVINNLIYSSHLEPPIDPSTMPDPCGQFAFLQTELEGAGAAGQHVLLISHIPPVLDAFATVVNSSRRLPYFSSNVYLDRMSGLIQRYRDIITLQLYGHTHRFAPIAVTDFGVAGIIAPAVSPGYGNNPSYLVAEYDLKSQLIKDVRMKALVQDKWKFMHPSLNGIHFHHNVARLRSAMHALLLDEDAWAQFEGLHTSGSTGKEVWPHGECNSTCRTSIICSILENKIEAFDQCLIHAADPPSGSYIDMVSAILVAASTVLILGLIAIIALWYRNNSGQREEICADLKEAEVLGAIQ